MGLNFRRAVAWAVPAAIVVVIASPASGHAAQSRLTQTAAAELAPAGAPLALSGNTLVAGDYVFANTPGREWSTGAPVALLEADGGSPGEFVATSGRLIATAAADAGYVFLEPTGGWSGVTQPAATLELPFDNRNSLGTSVAMSGQTIFVDGDWETADGQVRQDVFVFTRPTDGWSGDIRPSAVLTANGGPGFAPPGTQSVATSGSTVFVASNNNAQATTVAYVFNQPHHGWSGHLTQTGYLTAKCDPGGGTPVELAASGPTVAADCGAQATNELHDLVAIYTQPVGGWRRETSPAGSLTFVPQEGDVSAASVAVSANAIAVLTAGESSQGPGLAQTFVVKKPAAGWSGLSRFVTRPADSESGSGDIALNSADLFVDTGGVVKVESTATR